MINCRGLRADFRAQINRLRTLIREQPGMSAADTLARVLAGQELLLVLDNCEHVIGAAAQLCAGLLAACDDVRVLATSREPLAVAGGGPVPAGPAVPARARW